MFPFRERELLGIALINVIDVNGKNILIEMPAEEVLFNFQSIIIFIFLVYIKVRSYLTREL